MQQSSDSSVDREALAESLSSSRAEDRYSHSSASDGSWERSVADTRESQPARPARHYLLDRVSRGQSGGDGRSAGRKSPPGVRRPATDGETHGPISPANHTQ